MNLFTLFVVLNVVNVIIQTIKSLCTVKCSKWVASLVSALAHGLYAVVLVYMNCDIPLWQKVLVVGGANLIGVFVVKYAEEKLRKDKLWKIEFTTNNEKFNPNNVIGDIDACDIPFRYDHIGKHTVFTCYCSTQIQSALTKAIIDKYNGKYFASESKVL